MREVIYMLLLLFLSACTFDEEPSPCPYNLRIDYWYAGAEQTNILPTRVHQLRQYLFDERGLLVDTYELSGARVTHWEKEVPPGDYTMVAWGNIDTASYTRLPIAGAASLANFLLTNAELGVPPGFRGNSERLYFGTGSFTVRADGVTRKRVYVTHSHAALRLTIRWLRDPPPASGNYRLRLRDIPTEYGFISGREIDAPGSDNFYMIPRIGNAVTNHETRAAINYKREVTGELVSYRYTTGTHLLLSLYRNDELLMREIDLEKFFSKSPIDLDHNVEQEFDLLITIDGDKITVSEMAGFDWEEGGTLG